MLSGSSCCVMSDQVSGVCLKLSVFKFQITKSSHLPFQCCGARLPQDSRLSLPCLPRRFDSVVVSEAASWI